MQKILLIFFLYGLCASAANISFSRDLSSASQAPNLQALDKLIKSQSAAPTLEGIKLIFAHYSNGAPPARQSAEKSIPQLSAGLATLDITDEIILWLKTEAAASPNKDIRQLAFWLTGRHPSAPLNLEFARIFLYDPAKEIRLENINRIKKLPIASIIPLLTTALTDGYYPVRKSVIETLTECNNTPQAVDILIQRYPDETSMTLRFEIEEAIIRAINQSGQSDALLEHLASDDPAVRALAIRALGKCAPINKKESYIKALNALPAEMDADALASRKWALTHLQNPGTGQVKIDIKPPAGSAAPASLTRRFEPGRSEMLLKYGGNDTTENAARLGLEWLVRNQEPDGSWNCVKHNPWHNNVVLPAFTTEDELIDVSLTGLALLCFLGDGSTHQSGPYQSAILKGLEFIKSAQDKTGCINIPKNHVHNERCLIHGRDHGMLPRRYNHNISTLMLVELYAMTNDIRIKDMAQRALEHSKSTPEPGFPWSFYLEPTDMGPSIFYILALRIALETDLLVSPKEIARTKVYLDRLTDKESGRIVHICPIPICFGGMDSTASGLFGHILMKSDPALIAKSADWLKAFPPQWEPFYQYTDYYPNLLYLENNIMNEWHWYYQTLAFRQLGGAYWTDWNQRHKELLIRYQRQGGLLDGSWDPEGPWATIGGRIYSTAFSVLSLQAYYSYSFK